MWHNANSDAAGVAAKVAASSVAVLRGEDLLPLPQDGRPIALIRVPDQGERRADSARHAPDAFPEILNEYRTALRVEAGGDIPAEACAVVVYGYDTGRGQGQVSGAAAEASRLANHPVPIVQVAFGDAEDLAGSGADVLIAAYSPHSASAEVAAKILLCVGGLIDGQLPRGEWWR
ncbi:hypothetical protein ACWCQL_35885 [Streptomyces sp. NPDC002073]